MESFRTGTSSLIWHTETWKGARSNLDSWPSQRAPKTRYPVNVEITDLKEVSKRQNGRTHHHPRFCLAGTSGIDIGSHCLFGLSCRFSANREEQYLKIQSELSRHAIASINAQFDQVHVR